MRPIFFFFFFFFFFTKKYCYFSYFSTEIIYGYSLEVPPQDTHNEYLQCIFYEKSEIYLPVDFANLEQ